jgi:hypothetical protein
MRQCNTTGAKHILMHYKIIQQGFLKQDDMFVTNHYKSAIND